MKYTNKAGYDVCWKGIRLAQGESAIEKNGKVRKEMKEIKKTKVGGD